ELAATLHPRSVSPFSPIREPCSPPMSRALAPESVRNLFLMRGEAPVLRRLGAEFEVSVCGLREVRREARGAGEGCSVASAGPILPVGAEEGAVVGRDGGEPGRLGEAVADRADTAVGQAGHHAAEVDAVGPEEMPVARGVPYRRVPP